MKWCSKWFSKWLETPSPRWLEELVPFLAYLHDKWKIDRELDNAIQEGSLSKPIQRYVDQYSTLDQTQLKSFLEAEHTRTESLVDKTFKFGAVYATGLTIASIAILLISDKLQGDCWKWVLFAFMFPTFVFIASAGMLGLSAIRVQRWFGWGAAAAAEHKDKSDQELISVYARDLALQQRLNNINTTRNEAAFMSLRNGLLLLIITILIAFAGLLSI